MKRLLLTAALTATTLVTTSCIAGPSRLRRNFDTWVNQQYSEDAYIHGALLQNILPAYPLGSLIATAGDLIIMNPWVFWSKDAWDRKGTAYEYRQPVGATRVVTGWKDESLDGD